MRVLGLLIVFASGCLTSTVLAQDEKPPIRQLVVVRGASGSAEYGQQFDSWAERWMATAKKSDLEVVRIGPEGPSEVEPKNSDLSQLGEVLSAASDSKVAELWLVLIGHGTFDGKTARFNLRGPDFSTEDLKRWLAARQGRCVIINCASSSGPFLSALSGSNRVVVTAAKSGAEQNFARFGDYLSAAIGNPEHDLDKDGQTSLFEAFLIASRQTEQFYAADGRLETEHAVLDDNADGEGVRADWFRGLRLIKKPDHGRLADGTLAHQMHLTLSPADQRLPLEVRQKRDDTLRAIIALRSRKGDFTDLDAYFAELEQLCIELAKLDATASK